METAIIYEDEHLLVANKPAGLSVEPDRLGNPSLLELLKAQLEKKTKRKELFLQNVHRLDRPVCGLVLFAKKPSALKLLNQIFQERKVEKYYRATTQHCPEKLQGTLVHYHKKDVLQKRAILLNEARPGYERVALKYSVQKSQEGLYLWSIQLLTGKYHQIRAQLGMLACPILGDALYGSTQQHIPGIALESYRLKFTHPITGQVLDLVLP